MNMTEILAPAGNEACAEAAISAGANAIYLGYSSFSARASAENFDADALRAIIGRAHFLGVKVYVAMNTLVKEAERESFCATLVNVWNLGADAIIVQDALLGKAIHAQYPEIVLHLSTQAGTCSKNGASFAKECGFSRVILSRETPLAEIEKIAKILETEVFVQGALCTAFSGQCFFSSFVGGNSGNRGRCKQPCRKKYSWDREGFESPAYALSLSDLSVGEDIEKLKNAGVVSFKIEGRMRRPEYVAAATIYYRKLLGVEDGAAQAFSDLKRTYNRGNYTKGLAFGQDKRFLSRRVQGHIGEKIGVVRVENGKYFVESKQPRKAGDSFKILRKGKEVGGGAFEKSVNRGFLLSSSSRLYTGDDVFVTTDVAVNERVLSSEKRRKLSVSLFFRAGEHAIAEGGGVRVVSEEVLPHAQTKPLTERDLKECFFKTDGLPLDVFFETVESTDDVFLPKSLLNAFRRKFYETLVEKTNVKKSAEYVARNIEPSKGKNEKKAMISSDFSCLSGKIDIGIYKPKDYREPLPNSFKNGTFEKYIYCPVFLTTEEEESIAKIVSENDLDGVYAESYAALMLAKKNGFSVFVGTGLHLANLAAIEELNSYPVRYYTLSKELSERETRCLTDERAFVLTNGDIKLMDLCYCPFEKTCSSCDKKAQYVLTDENARAFPVRRYTVSGACRFELFNCVGLVGKNHGVGCLSDATLTPARELNKAQSEEDQKRLFGSYTFGHAKNGVL